MKELDNISISLPHDIALKIASSLLARDVCALGSCCRFWREICESDQLWISLSSQRWPSLNLPDHFVILENSGWKGFYIKRHKEMAERATEIVKFVEECSSSASLEVRDYLKAIEELGSMQLGFEDVGMFILKPELHVLQNLVGLHYCLNWLGVPSESVMGALERCNISERQVCVKWWKLGRWFYGFRLRDESHYRRLSLAELVTSKEEEVLSVLRRGAIYEVIRVQISVADPLAYPWTCPSGNP